MIKFYVLTHEKFGKTDTVMCVGTKEQVLQYSNDTINSYGGLCHLDECGVQPNLLNGEFDGLKLINLSNEAVDDCVAGVNSELCEEFMVKTESLSEQEQLKILKRVAFGLAQHCSASKVERLFEQEFSELANEQ